jgi:hypothetical protein
MWPPGNNAICSDGGPRTIIVLGADWITICPNTFSELEAAVGDDRSLDYTNYEIDEMLTISNRLFRSFIMVFFGGDGGLGK